MSDESTIQDVLEIVLYLKDNMVTKDDLETRLTETKTEIKLHLDQNFVTKDDLRNFATKDDLQNFSTKDDLRHFATKDDLFEFKSDIMTHMDGFIGLHQKLDVELVAMRSKYERLESYIQQLARHAQLELH